MNNLNSRQRVLDRIERVRNISYNGDMRITNNANPEGHNQYTEGTAAKAEIFKSVLKRMSAGGVKVIAGKKVTKLEPPPKYDSRFAQGDYYSIDGSERMTHEQAANHLAGHKE